MANSKALLKSAIRSDNPIIFFEHVLLYNVKGEAGWWGAGWLALAAVALWGARLCCWLGRAAVLAAGAWRLSRG